MSVSLQFCPFCQIACSVALPVLWVAPSQFVGWNVFRNISLFFSPGINHWNLRGPPNATFLRNPKKQEPNKAL